MTLRSVTWLGLSLLAVGLGGGDPAHGGEAQPLAVRAAHALEARALDGSRWGALVVDARDGQVLFAHRPERGFVPASNQKLLTALAALSHFGPTHRFTTSIYADAPLDAEGRVGILYVRGGGDPALTSEDFWRLAADLRRAGLRRVGRVVLDDGIFDAERWHPSWGTVSSRAYHAPVGGLAANYGAFAVAVRPGAKLGAPASAALDPPVDYLALRVRARTGPPGRPSRLIVDRIAGDGVERVGVSGFVSLDAAERVFYRSVTEPALYAGSVLRWQLEANGIEVESAPERGTIPAEARLLLEFEGRPLAEVVRLFLKYSNNMIAEALVKAMGSSVSGEGSWPAGMAALRAELSTLGLPLEGVVLVDGSGLSRENRVSPRLLVEALRTARSSFAFGPEFVAALPIGAGDGTLAERMPDAAGAVRAKTGLLDRVVSLSGFAHTRAGRELVFALLVNEHRARDLDAMQAVDGFVHALVDDAGALGGPEPPATTLGPRPASAQESMGDSPS